MGYQSSSKNCLANKVCGLFLTLSHLEKLILKSRFVSVAVPLVSPECNKRLTAPRLLMAAIVC